LIVRLDDYGLLTTSILNHLTGIIRKLDSILRLGKSLLSISLLVQI